MPIVSVNLVVFNGEKYIRHFLRSLERQTYSRDYVQFNIFDNGSTDGTKKIVRGMKPDGWGFRSFHFVESPKNLGMWPGQEELLKYTDGKYVVASAVDVIVREDFIRNSVDVMETDKRVGALQAKIYRYDLVDGVPQRTNVIDTAGFRIFRSRRIVNIGHGEEDGPRFNTQEEVFAVEGAVPVFRKEALVSCGAAGEIADHDYFWYGDDLDLAWRMRLFGWREIFAPTVVAWHDRQTTKSTRTGWRDLIARVSARRRIPIRKRRLDWRNVRWTLVKNDYEANVLRDLPRIVFRELAVLAYAVLLEPGVLKEIPTFFRYLPKMLRKRKEIMKRAVVGPEEMRRWFR